LRGFSPRWDQRWLPPALILKNYSTFLQLFEATGLAPVRLAFGQLLVNGNCICPHFLFQWVLDGSLADLQAAVLGC
jgi:hypothetical protein